MRPRTINTAFAKRAAVSLTAAVLGCTVGATVFAQTVDLADKPLFSSTLVPGNLLLALSVEWPTASTPAYPNTDAYANTNEYLGYFDPAKCYRYVYDSSTPANSYFTPHGAAAVRKCTSNSSNALWSGNFLNYATMQSLDIFRWVLTGGDRAVDNTTTTILEKTRHSGQGGYGIFPNKEITSGTTIRELSPFRWTTMAAKVYGEGTSVVFSATTGDTATSGVVNYTGNYDPPSATSGTTNFYRVYMRIKACDSGVGVESNCTQYGTNYKPEGLMQKYAMQLRYGAFGYLNDGNLLRDGGVLRARLKSVGPQSPVPGSTPVTNANAEWSSSTGVYVTNPDSADATATTADTASAGYSVTVNRSGVVNYLNRFGKLGGTDYKSFDPVGELYYAATRYLKNQGNVSSYSSLSGAGSLATMTQWVDGFPVIKTWGDPFLKDASNNPYSCQRNFILGIGDVYAWSDKNLPGVTSSLRSTSAGNWGTPYTPSEPGVPSEVSSDTTVNVTTATNMVGTLEGLSNLGTQIARDGAAKERANSSLIAGLAYDNHTKDIRSDLTGTQTIDTYWLDVREAQTYESKNQYWLAAKYGGFKVPAGFDPYATTNSASTLSNSMWSTTGETVGSDPRPDNYFIASNPAALRDGLSSAFEAIALASAATTATAFSTTTAKVSRTGTGSYATKYNPLDWTGDVEGSEMKFNANGVPSLTSRWSAQAKLDATAATDRKIITCCTSGNAAIPFRSASMTGLHSRTDYTTFGNVTGASSQSQSGYLDYLRGDRTKELGNGGVYRARGSALGDLVNSKANPVGRPAFPYSDQFNAGYSSFKSSYVNRKTVVYVGSNNGMLHAFDGDVAASCTNCGKELFAFVPSFVYGDTTTGPTHGLASLGNKNFTHRPMVDGSPKDFDVDLAKTSGSGTTTPDWRTMLVGGLGKGGKGYYALDITNPTTWTTESTIATKFMWEFTDSRMGYTLGEPVVAKTTKWGWVVALPSGVSNSDGKGYLFLVNPKTGALLEAIATSEGTTAAPLNMAQITGYVPSGRDFTLDAIYGTDMRGNVWRFDLTPASGSYAAPTKIAELKDSGGTSQPITVRPAIAVDPSTGKRYVVIGTGKLLADSDITSSQTQSIYAIVDGTSGAGGFYKTGSMPTGFATFPVRRANLDANTDLLTGVTSPTKVMGWYFDLAVTSSIAERVNIDMESNQGVVTVGVNLPNGQACNPEGSGRLLSMKLSNGKSMLVQTVSGVNTLVTSASSSGMITTIAILNVSGQNRIYYGTAKTQTTALPVDPNDNTKWCSDVTGQPVNCVDPSANISWRRLNWREVQPAN
jgi:type IV pilus assembly protein PilY1